MATWQEHMAGNVTWAETGITEHQLLEYTMALEDGRVAGAHGWQRHMGRNWHDGAPSFSRVYYSP
jgi:hypothetical protein